ncbi:MAG: inositol monophosphatase family protein [Candidatus Omnitrophota bacterium]
MVLIPEDRERQELLSLAKKAAKEGGEIHRRYYHQDIPVQTKGVSFDLVSVVDTESEKCILDIIQKHYPAHNLLSEERGIIQKGSELTWVIDPLDGTTNFIFGIPLFCSSVALVYGNQTVVGAVYDAVHDEMFSAVAGQGAWLNDQRISVSSVGLLEESMMITGFFYDRSEAMIKNLESMKHFFEASVRGIRRFGSAALDLCYVASGRATGFWEFRLNPWDFAAGALIVQEAGGTVSNLRGENIDPTKQSYIVASNGRIHPEVLSILQMVEK